MQQVDIGLHLWLCFLQIEEQQKLSDTKRPYSQSSLCPSFLLDIRDKVLYSNGLVQPWQSMFCKVSSTFKMISMLMFSLLKIASFLSSLNVLKTCFSFPVWIEVRVFVWLQVARQTDSVIFTLSCKNSICECTTMGRDVFPLPGWKISHLLFQLWLAGNLLTLRPLKAK